MKKINKKLVNVISGMLLSAGVFLISSMPVYATLNPHQTDNPAIDLTGSEFIDALIQKLLGGAYQGIWDNTNEQFNEISDVMKVQIESSSRLVSQTPQVWNVSAFSFVEGVAKNAVIPIAGCILVFIFCWQMIGMVQESNQMHNIRPDTMLLLLLKLGICLTVCSRSFEIVNGLFDVAAWGVSNIKEYNPDASGAALEFANHFERELAEYSFGDIMRIASAWLLTMIAKYATYVVSICIYLRVNIWYLELLLYASAAPIPFSTFINKEWGQVGMNYLRKMLAMAFEGFFMIVAFGLYSALVTHALTASGNDSYLLSICLSIGCGVALLMIISKAGTISASVFNAH